MTSSYIQCIYDDNIPWEAFQYYGYVWFEAAGHRTYILQCNKTCLAGLLIHLILCRKNCMSASAQVQFFQCKIEWMYAVITYLLSIWTTTSRKMLMNKKLKSQTVTENPTRNLLCKVLEWHALNMSCNFGQSVPLIESRCLVMQRFYGLLCVDLGKMKTWLLSGIEW